MFMRGEAEQRSLDIVKEKYNDSCRFAMSYEDDLIIEDALSNAKPNPQISSFPDFVFEGGFIEHFQVTSSYENRKGSTMQRENSELIRDFNKKVEEATENLAPDCITIQSVSSHNLWHKQHSYEYFVDSFRSNFENHLVSMRKYSGNKKHGIFLIEYTDSALCMTKRYATYLMLEVSYGDLLTRENPAYRLSRDIDLLRYIYDKSDEIEFVIFVNKNGFHGTWVDVIKSVNALEIIKLLHEGYDFHCAMIGSSHFGIGVSVPKHE